MSLNKLIKSLNDLLKSGKLEVEEMEIVNEAALKLTNLKNFMQHETGYYEDGTGALIL